MRIVSAAERAGAAAACSARYSYQKPNDRIQDHNLDPILSHKLRAIGTPHHDTGQRIWLRNALSVIEFLLPFADAVSPVPGFRLPPEHRHESGFHNGLRT